VTDSLRRRLAVQGARKSYLQNCESMQRVHISPRRGSTPVDRVTIADVETVAAAMLDAGLAPKTVRNVITFMHSIFEHAVDRGWTTQNPVRRASRPKRRRAGDASSSLTRSRVGRWIGRS
jgi:site-specific recombinase XerD